MKKIYIILLFLTVFISCIPGGEEDCNNGTEFVENLVYITPIQSQFQVNDTLTISCSIPSQNNFYSFSLNFLEETNNRNAIWFILQGEDVIRDQELIIRKGLSDKNNFIAVYNTSCDCYEFEADLVLSDIRTYNINLINEFDFIGNDCNKYFIETDFMWVNTPGVIEFEVVP